MTKNEFELKPIERKAKKMWYLVYTLVRNPDLLELRRRSRLDSKTTSSMEVKSNGGDTSVFGIVNELGENYDDSKVKENP